MGLMGFMGLMGLMGCSEDSEDSGRVTIEAQYCASEFADVEQPGSSRTVNYTTRTWTTPEYTDYKNETKHFVTYDYLNGMFNNQKNLVNKSIGVFLTKDGEPPLETSFFYRTTSEGSRWQMSLDEIPAGDYHIYGFIPKEDAESAAIRANESYGNGAILTIHGLNTVTPSDVCVIVGAKDDGTWQTSYDSDEASHTVYGLEQGQFDVTFRSGDGAKNFIFLLFDHLYSALRFRFTVHPEYAALRTIKLRKLELTSYQDKHETGVRAKYNATITLQQNDSGDSPIVNVIFSPDITSAYVSQAPIFDGEVKLPVYPELPEEFMGCFVPGDYRHFKLRSTYDVYDNNITPEHPDGNLIRQGCQAENSFDLTQKFGNDLKVTRGHSYSYTITVQPTYLYMLSEPDLDNPTLNVEH